MKKCSRYQKTLHSISPPTMPPGYTKEDSVDEPCWHIILVGVTVFIVLSFLSILITIHWYIGKLGQYIRNRNQNTSTPQWTKPLYSLEDYPLLNQAKQESSSQKTSSPVSESENTSPAVQFSVQASQTDKPIDSVSIEESQFGWTLTKPGKEEQ